MARAKAREREEIRAMGPIERVLLALELGRRGELFRSLRPRRG